MEPVIMITGAGGLGTASAVQLGRRGKILLTDVSQKSLDEAKAYLDKLGIKADTCIVDVSDRDSVAKGLEKAKSLGPVKTIVNTAGISMACNDAKKINHINVNGVFNITDLALPVLEEGGCLINFASAAAYGVPMTPDLKKLYMSMAKREPGAYEKFEALANDPDKAYGMSKKFVIFYTELMTMTYGQAHKRINCISPSNTETNMLKENIARNPQMFEMAKKSTPLGRFGHPYELAAAVEFLASDEASYITGQDLAVDGGLKALCDLM